MKPLISSIRQFLTGIVDDILKVILSEFLCTDCDGASSLWSVSF